MDNLTQLNINFREEKEQSQRLGELRDRASRCVCRYCGQPLSLRKYTYAAYDEAKIELYCAHCDRIEYGTEAEIYKMAHYYTEKMNFDCYPYLDESVNKKQMNTAVICDILSWGFKSAGMLKQKGFSVPVDFAEEDICDYVMFDDKFLQRLQEEK